MQTADVVIIGGGIVGASIAYHLTEAGCKNVLIVERETSQGKGSTGKSMGGVRAQFATPVNIQMSLYSIPFYASFDERLGYPADYRPQGYLFLATSEAHLKYLRTNQELQKSLGLKGVRMVSGEEVRAWFPQLRADDVLGGSFCETDGFVDPYSAMVGFTERAKEAGAELWRGTEVTGIRLSEGRVQSVETSRGTVETRTVVNAAGAWAAGVEISLLKQGVPLRQNFWTDKVNGGALCLDSAGSMESLAKQVEGDYVLPDGRKFRLAVRYTESVPNSSDKIIVPVAMSQPYLLYWRGHAYVVESAVWNEYIYPNGQKYMEIKELTLIDPYESGEKRRVKYDVQTNGTTELGGTFQVIATQLNNDSTWK